MLDRESHFSKIRAKEQVVKKSGKHWLPVSLTLLALVSGGLLMNRDNVSANAVRLRHGTPTYNLIDPSTISNRRRSVRPSRANVHQFKGRISRPDRRVIRKDTHRENGRPNVQNSRTTLSQSADHDLNNLQLYQSKRCNGAIFSRVSTPFNTIRVNRPVYLHSLPSLSGRRGLPRVTRGDFRILRAFNQYSGHNTAIHYLINFHYRHYYITGDPKRVAFVLPSTNYRYYQDQINNILASHPNNGQFEQISQSIDSLNAQHVIDYHTYLSLYIDTYNLLQEEHPLFLSNLVNKQQIAGAQSNSTPVDPAEQDSIASSILNQISQIETACQQAANNDHQSMDELNALGNSTIDNHLTQIASSEVITNNQLVKALSNHVSNALGQIDDPASLKLVTNVLDFQMQLANNVKADADRILNNDVQNLTLMAS